MNFKLPTLLNKTKLKMNYFNQIQKISIYIWEKSTRMIHMQVLPYWIIKVGYKWFWIIKRKTCAKLINVYNYDDKSARFARNEFHYP